MDTATCTIQLAVCAFGNAFYKGNQAFFQHQDWLGSERIETSASGGVANRVGELVFGDHSNLGRGLDDYQFAGMDTDLETDSHHAQYRQYDSIAGRWMSPDPYDGSYDPSNPQSFNRYSYVMNNPLSLTDPTGQFTNGSYCGDSCPDDGSGFVNLFVDIGQALASLFGFGGPSFHGSLHPRPAGTGNPQWDGNFGESLGISTKIRMGSWGIAQALGLPDAGCEFGACGAGPMGFWPNNSGAPFTDHWGLDSVFELLGWKIPYLNHVNDKNTRLFSTHYCGPGGGGSVSPGLDAACAAHDACYTRAGVGVWDNWNLNLSPDKQAAIQNCNQNLCNAVRSLKGGGAWAVNQTFANVWGVYTCQ